MTVQTLAADVGVDPGDVDVVTRWLTADGEVLGDTSLEAALRAILDPAGQRTGWAWSACPDCGRLPGRHRGVRAHPLRAGARPAAVHRSAVRVQRLAGASLAGQLRRRLSKGWCCSPTLSRPCWTSQRSHATTMS
jgi:hypothetical protein